MTAAELQTHNTLKKIDLVITALHFTATLVYSIAQALSELATSGSKCDTGLQNH